MPRSVHLTIALALAMGLLAGCSSDSGPVTPSDSSSSSARYRMEFRATWSRALHPTDFPADAHFSRLVGATHASAANFWRDATLATTGIKDMAERGRTSPLDTEIRAAIAAGTADQLIVGGDIPQSPGAVSVEFDMNRGFPLVTMVSMVAPSPDWFVGVTGLALYENGGWVSSREASLLAWDAGTDSGSTFTSPDFVTSPAAPISRIATAPLAPGGQATPLGTFTFTRVR